MFGLSLVVESEAYSLVLVHGLLTAVTSLVASQGLWARGLRRCDARA